MGTERTQICTQAGAALPCNDKPSKRVTVKSAFAASSKLVAPWARYVSSGQCVRGLYDA